MKALLRQHAIREEYKEGRKPVIRPRRQDTPPTSLLQTGGWPAKFVVPIIKQCLCKAKFAVKRQQYVCKFCEAGLYKLSLTAHLAKKNPAQLLQFIYDYLIIWQHNRVVNIQPLRFTALLRPIKNESRIKGCRWLFREKICEHCLCACQVYLR